MARASNLRIILYLFSMQHISIFQYFLEGFYIMWLISKVTAKAAAEPVRRNSGPQTVAIIGAKLRGWRLGWFFSQRNQPNQPNQCCIMMPLGGGVAGLACAKRLRSLGLSPTVFDTGKREPGGRASSRLWCLCIIKDFKDRNDMRWWMTVRTSIRTYDFVVICR